MIRRKIMITTSVVCQARQYLPRRVGNHHVSFRVAFFQQQSFSSNVHPKASLHFPRLLNKVALVTGSSSGLGRAISLAYASHGAKLVVCADRQVNSMFTEGENAETTTTHGLINEIYGENKAMFLKVDVGEGEDVKKAVALAVNVGGRLDIMVNNAGIGTENRYIRIHQLEDEAWDKVMRVNVRGVYLGCKYACEQFLKQPLNEHGRRGWIVNVSSMLGYVGITGGASAYCASKAAVLNLTRQIAVDYARDRIHCNALCPGFTKTAMTRPNYEDKAVNAEMIATTPWGEWGNPADVAKGAVFLASDDAAWVQGIGLPVDGGYLAQ